MKTLKISLLIALSIVFLGKAQAQNAVGLSDVEVKNLHIKKGRNDKKGRLYISMNMDVTKMDLGRQQTVILTPIVETTDGKLSKQLPPVVLNGAIRDIVKMRREKLGEDVAYSAEPYVTARRYNKKEQAITYQVVIPQEEWMKEADLVIRKVITGCADCLEQDLKATITNKVLKDDFVPIYKTTLITPKVEPVKRRSASHAAHFNYKVARHELLPDFGNNAQELAAVDNVIREIKGDKDLTITDLTISGYASPEGTFNSNMPLSQRRANTFADYLVSKYGLNKNQFKVSWYGEDWVGLEKAVQASTLADKEAILNIIATVETPDARDAQLMKLSGGTTYKFLLENLYPPLRRNEYTIAYVARAFDVEEAKRIIKTKPQLLSLNEMYLVAQTYPKDSPEYKEVFDIAARMFPNDPVGNINAATVELESGNIDAAIRRLERFRNMPETWNPMGVALAKKERLSEAMSYFKRAAEQGDTLAKANAEQLRLYIEDRQ